MNLFKKLFCKHEFKTLTNIHGDLINAFGCRSIQECVKCGKCKKLNELDESCTKVNFQEKSR